MIEINYFSTALIIIALAVAYFSIRETRCPGCGALFAIYGERKARYYVCRCRKCDNQWTQENRRIAPGMFVYELYRSIREGRLLRSKTLFSLGLLFAYVGWRVLGIRETPGITDYTTAFGLLIMAVGVGCFVLGLIFRREEKL